MNGLRGDFTALAAGDPRIGGVEALTGRDPLSAMEMRRAARAPEEAVSPLSYAAEAYAAWGNLVHDTFGPGPMELTAQALELLRAGDGEGADRLLAEAAMQLVGPAHIKPAGARVRPYADALGRLSDLSSGRISATHHRLPLEAQDWYHAGSIPDATLARLRGPLTQGDFEAFARASPDVHIGSGLVDKVFEKRPGAARWLLENLPRLLGRPGEIMRNYIPGREGKPMLVEPFPPSPDYGVGVLGADDASRQIGVRTLMIRDREKIDAQRRREGAW